MLYDVSPSPMAQLFHTTLFFLALLLLLLTSYTKFRNSGAAAADASALAGTKVRQPWGTNSASKDVQLGRNYTSTYYDFFNDSLTKFLDVGACTLSSDAISYVPPLDGTNPDEMLCQNEYGMRFVLFDLQLVNVDAVDALSGSFTAQFQLVFHWTEGWEVSSDVSDDSDTRRSYQGGPITTEDEAAVCGFECDSTSAVKRCCDRMWVPPLQVPSCTTNAIDSVTPHAYLHTTWNSALPTNVKNYTVRRTWYVGLDVTCPFVSEFHNFPYDYQFLTVDIINPYASHTWLQLNKGFLEANIVDSIAGINLSPDRKIDGWKIKDLLVSSACGTQQTWKPTFLTQDYILQLLGDHYKSQRDEIINKLNDIKCATIQDIILEHDISLSNPTNNEPYNQTKIDYTQRLDDTIAKYKECTSTSTEVFNWSSSIDENNMPTNIRQFNVSDGANVNRSFSFLDFQYRKGPIDGISFQCVIDAIANLTTPGIRINVIIQRYPLYYILKLVLPTCACVGFSFTTFGLGIDSLLGRLTVVVPSAVALSALQGYVVATDIPAVAYLAPTTYIILVSYAMQLLIALESTLLAYRHVVATKRFLQFTYWIYKQINKKGRTHQTNDDKQSQSKGLMKILMKLQAILIPKSPKETGEIPSHHSGLNQESDGHRKRQTNEKGRTQQTNDDKESHSKLEGCNEKVESVEPSSNIDTPQTTKVVREEQSSVKGDEMGRKQQQKATLEMDTQQLTAWAKKIDWFCLIILGGIYIISILCLVLIPLWHSESIKEAKVRSGYESLWN